MKSSPEPVMNKPTKINSSRPADFISTDRIFYLSTLLLVFSLPFGKQLSVVSLAFFGISGLLYVIKNKEIFNRKISKLKSISFLTIYPLLSFFSIIYSSNLKYAISKSENLLFLLFVPLFLFILPQMSKKRFNFVMITFCVACFLSTGYPMMRIIRYYWNFKEITLWVIDDSLFIHRAYFGMYLVLCLFFIFTFFYNRNSGTPKIKLITFLILFTYFFLFLVLSLPKTALLATVFLFLLAIIYIRYEKFKIVRSLIVFIPVISLILIIAYVNVNLYLWDRSFSEGEKVYALTHKNILEIIANSANVRFSHWANAYLAWISEVKSFLFGYGIGDVKDVLNQFYLSNGLHKLASGNFNAHNTFLQISLATGLTGLTTFILLLVKSLHVGLKSGNGFLVFFILLFVLCSATESMLMRQKGVLFFAIFFGLFLFHAKNRNWKPIN